MASRNSTPELFVFQCAPIKKQRVTDGKSALLSRAPKQVAQRETLGVTTSAKFQLFNESKQDQITIQKILLEPNLQALESISGQLNQKPVDMQLPEAKQTRMFSTKPGQAN